MKYLHCTKKLYKEISSEIPDSNDEHEIIGLGDWYANIFWINGDPFLVFTNVKTLLSFILDRIYKDSVENIAETFMSGLIYTLKGFGYSEDVISKIVLEYTAIKIVKTNSKSIIASMNDIVWHFEVYHEKHQKGNESIITEFNKNIANLPIKSLKFRTPKEKLSEYIKEEVK